jgi:hypothetical protein
VGYRTTFEKVEMYGTKSVKCVGGCGRRLKRSIIVYQTINPFNETADGRLKNREDIRAELVVELSKWKLKPEQCIHCDALVTASRKG